MRPAIPATSPDLDTLGHEMHELIRELYPICRSITGNGFRQTLEYIQKRIPITVRQIPTGSHVFDWTIPKEWNIKDAYVKNAAGERVIDFLKSNLHVVNYSVPIHTWMTLDELKNHLFTLPEHPDWIPYRTSYYNENWGFCLSQHDMMNLPEGQYEVCIDSTLENGNLTYGECYLEGTTTNEILISCHACHPSLCNDNLSGIAVATMLAQYGIPLSSRYSYRFLFIPGTIGSITWLSLNEPKAARIKHGVVLTGLGDSGGFTYKKTRRGNAEVDEAFDHVLQHSGAAYEIEDFVPYGYDERQYCSPGFNLPVGCFMRTPHGRYPQYHTSADNLEFVTAASLASSFSLISSVFSLIEANKSYLNQNPKCEPQLGKRGLYRIAGGEAGVGIDEYAMLWVLNLSDGSHSLLDIADRAKICFNSVKRAAIALEEHGLLKEVNRFDDG